MASVWSFGEAEGKRWLEARRHGLVLLVYLLAEHVPVRTPPVHPDEWAFQAQHRGKVLDAHRGYRNCEEAALAAVAWADGWHAARENSGGGDRRPQ